MNVWISKSVILILCSKAKMQTYTYIQIPDICINFLCIVWLSWYVFSTYIYFFGLFECLFFPCCPSLCFRRGREWYVGSSGPSSPPVRRKTGLDHAVLYGDWFQTRASTSHLEVSIRRPPFKLSNQPRFKQQTSRPRSCGSHHSGHKWLAIV